MKMLGKLLGEWHPRLRKRSTNPNSAQESAWIASRRSTVRVRAGSVAKVCRIWYVAILRWAAGRDPDDRDLSDLVGEFATHSEAFRTRWAVHDAAFTLSTANGGEPFGQHGKEGRRRRL
jgi:hypothetical protein